jgi:hypothetical protein
VQKISGTQTAKTSNAVKAIARKTSLKCRGPIPKNSSFAAVWAAREDGKLLHNWVERSGPGLLNPNQPVKFSALLFKWESKRFCLRRILGPSLLVVTATLLVTVEAVDVAVGDVVSGTLGTNYQYHFDWWRSSLA